MPSIWSISRAASAFQLPAAGLATAIAVFGITGVGATELVMYPVLVRREGVREVRRRARWIGGVGDEGPRVDSRHAPRHHVLPRDLHFATVAFYLLGAGVLNRMGLVPAERDTVTVLSNIYTQTLGAWALWLFYIGAVVTLYGTVFASTAAHARLFADAVRIAGGPARDDGASRRRWRNRFVVVLSVVPVTFYWFLRSPVQMVVAGGIAQALMLPLIGGAVIYLRHTQLPDEIRPTPRRRSCCGYRVASCWRLRRIRVVADVAMSYRLALSEHDTSSTMVAKSQIYSCAHRPSSCPS